MKTTKIRGQLEIDHDRGVIYFHVGTTKQIEKFKAPTILRLSRLGNIPVPNDDEPYFLDYTFIGHKPDLADLDMES